MIYGEYLFKVFPTQYNLLKWALDLEKRLVFVEITIFASDIDAPCRKTMLRTKNCDGCILDKRKKK